MEALREIQRSIFGAVDWLMFFCAVALSLLGIVTMRSFVGEDIYFDRQLIWLALGAFICIGASIFDYRILRKSGIVFALFLFSIFTLGALFLFGEIVKGAQSRFDIGILAIQPADPIKLVLIIVLAKYFSKRHVEIGQFKHILISGAYAFAIFALVFLQPDFGSALIIASIWFGMVLVSGISKKHLLIVFLSGALAFSGLWFYGFQDYQKQRILTFLNPLTDIQGAGYNAYQSTIAVGSGGLLGKGVGYGTQSKLEFLPEYETDFIFAAFSEEWGFVGAIVVFMLFGIIIWRVLKHARYGATNFEVLFAVGLAVLFITHIAVHVGMNIGLLPVTGTTVPFLSYGGSHLITEFLGMGILMGMSKYRRVIHSGVTESELIEIRSA